MDLCEIENCLWMSPMSCDTAFKIPHLFCLKDPLFYLKIKSHGMCQFLLTIYDFNDNEIFGETVTGWLRFICLIDSRVVLRYQLGGFISVLEHCGEIIFNENKIIIKCVHIPWEKQIHSSTIYSSWRYNHDNEHDKVLSFHIPQTHQLTKEIKNMIQNISYEQQILIPDLVNVVLSYIFSSI